MYFLTSAKIRGGWARFQSEFYQFGTGLNPLASLRLVSPGAVTESVALFLVIVLKSEINDLVMIHFQPLRLSSSSFVQCLLNSAAKKYLFSLGCHPPLMVSPRVPSLLSDATDQTYALLLMVHCFAVWESRGRLSKKDSSFLEGGR